VTSIVKETSSKPLQESHSLESTLSYCIFEIIEAIMLFLLLFYLVEKDESTLFPGETSSEKTNQETIIARGETLTSIGESKLSPTHFRDESSSVSSKLPLSSAEISSLSSQGSPAVSYGPSSSSGLSIKSGFSDISGPTLSVSIVGSTLNSTGSNGTSKSSTSTTTTSTTTTSTTTKPKVTNLKFFNDLMVENLGLD